MITFFYCEELVGLEKNQVYLGYIVAMQPQALYRNGEFTPELILEQLSKKKAMGVCIHAVTTAKSRNCYLM